MIFLILPLYVLSMAITLYPIAEILAQGEFQRYFAYFVAASSFLVLNLAGTISPNVRAAAPSSAYYLVFLITAVSLLVTYYALKVQSRKRFRPLQARFGAKLEELHLLYQSYAVMVLVFSVLGVGLFWATVTPPLFFRLSLFGHWGALVGDRISVVLSRPFHWYALALIEAPLFLSIVVIVIQGLARNQHSVLGGRWKAAALVVLPYAAITSVYVLSKQYLMYLLAAVLLADFIVRERVSVKKALLGSAIGLIGLIALYSVYTGFYMSKNYIRSVLRMTAHRISEVYPWAAAISFQIFPRQSGFLKGRSIPNFLHVFHYKEISVANMIYPRIYHHGVGSAPLPAAFESYANFGWPGILLTIAIVMAAIYVISRMSWSDKPFVFFLSVYLSLKIILAWQAPLWYGLLDPTIAVFIVVLWLILQAARGGTFLARRRASVGE